MLPCPYLSEPARGRHFYGRVAYLETILRGPIKTTHLLRLSGKLRF
jgi:hypothetical protein